MGLALTIPYLYVEAVGLHSPDRIFSFVVLLHFLGFVVAGAFRPLRRRPLPEGRVIAVVPAYNEKPDLLHGAIRSLLNGTVVPDVIHVVDDGSASPLPPFSHPRVVWHKRENGGKHHAQATALKAELQHFDFVVTVDSDSVVDRQAIERCLRPFSDPRIMGVTGVVYALNRARNMITRVTDLHYVHSCLVVRNGLSATGDIFTASGALAVWRSAVVMDNLTEYLSRGVADDRHLTHFAQRRGRTEAVPDAYVYTDVPDNAADLFRQRIRWARDYYRCTVLDIRYLSGWSWWMRTVDFAFMCLAPLFVLTALMVFPFAQWEVPWAGAGLWVAFLYTQTFCYVLERKGVGIGERILTWLFLTPVLYLFQLVVVGPAVLVALLNVRHHSWQTRNDKKAMLAVASQQAGRSRYLDTLRVVAIIRVVVFHATGFAWLGMIFPSMGIMFGLAGTLMARSMAKTGDRPEITIWNRFKRLMPALWMLAAVLIPVMLIMGWTDEDDRPFNAPAVFAWIFPLSDPPSNDWGVPVTGILWYIRTYLWLVLLSPVLWAAFRRWPRLTLVAPLALIPLSNHLTFSDWLSDVVMQLGTYAPCWIAGFWHASGRLQRLRAATTLPLAGLVAAGVFTWMYLKVEPGTSVQAVPPAQALLSLAFLAVLLRFDPAMGWLDKIKIGRLITRMNSRAVTIYLWHQLAILTSIAIVARARLHESIGEPGAIAAKFVLIGALVAAACWLVGWLEDITAPKSTPPPPAARHEAEVLSALNPKPEFEQTMIISPFQIPHQLQTRPPAPASSDERLPADQRSRTW
ncbi:acyltransferase family protein [Actinoplanes sp. OR16]|uniref:acyltransferase family protein n=1 Tax=Actinoplanes sp. OR16 TaxID=946334 RepID=UPI00135F1A13|nr:acyltransferase family protein [Actinoplanes sp. OR16]